MTDKKQTEVPTQGDSTVLEARPAGQELSAAEIIELAAALTSSKKERPIGVWERVWFVLLLLFIVAGPFGLPFLWHSREFPLWIKIVLTIIVLAILVYAVLMIWWIVAKYMTLLNEAGY